MLAIFNMVTSCEKRVLVTFGKRTRVIAFDEGDEEPRKVLALAKNVFKDFISEQEQFFLKIKDEEWGGEFVDVMPGQKLPHKSHLEMIKVYIKPCY